MRETEPWLDSNDPFERLIAIMKQLRAPENGCAWDIEQTFETIAPYTIEEAYEVSDAIDRQDYNDLKSELGDLLFQVVFHSQMADEAGHFDIRDVATEISEKMLRRHPHVFDDPSNRTSAEQSAAWETMKAAERKDTGASSAIDGVALSLPALLRAEKLQKRAARVGFDWTDVTHIFNKLEEETAEIKAAIESKDETAIEDEIGDLLFVGANIARRLGINPETALRRANAKFERRFKAMESLAEDLDTPFPELNLEQQEALWQNVKKQEA